MLVLAWARTYKIPYIIVRPTNNYGIRQYTEKFIPKVCKQLILENKIPLHENGTPVRTWLHVEDTVDAILKIIETESANEIYNISGNIELQNKVVAEKIIDIYFGKEIQNKENYFDYSFARQGQDVRYSINSDKLKNIGWIPIKNFNEELITIVNYYKENFIW
jgi:dTDP-glucose 4,6-dehydratase